jgi:hypothetical protein
LKAKAAFSTRFLRSGRNWRNDRLVAGRHRAGSRRRPETPADTLPVTYEIPARPGKLQQQATTTSSLDLLSFFLSLSLSFSLARLFLLNFSWDKTMNLHSGDMVCRVSGTMPWIFCVYSWQRPEIFASGAVKNSPSTAKVAPDRVPATCFRGR